MSYFEEYMAQADSCSMNQNWHDVYSEHFEHYDSHVDTDATH